MPRKTRQETVKPTESTQDVLRDIRLGHEIYLWEEEVRTEGETVDENVGDQI